MNFAKKEYDSDGADFSDLTAVNIAYTTTEDELHEIQADVNLIDYYIETKVDGKRVSSLRLRECFLYNQFYHKH